WGLERASIFRLVRHLETTDIRLLLVHPDADVVILLVREQHAVVAVVALDRLKDVPAAPRALIDRCVVAGFPAVPRGIAADDRALKRGDRFHDVFGSSVAVKHSLKLGAIVLQRI